MRTDGGMTYNFFGVHPILIVIFIAAFLIVTSEPCLRSGVPRSARKACCVSSPQTSMRVQVKRGWRSHQVGRVIFFDAHARRPDESRSRWLRFGSLRLRLG